MVRTGRRAVVRRSTIGESTRNCHQPNTANTSNDDANNPTVVAEDQPQLPPLEIPSSNATRATASSTVPSGSNRSALRGGRRGTITVNSTRHPTPIAVANQNRACHSKCWAMAAASGSPSAPPTPSEALINPIAAPTFSAGTQVRRTLIPSGMIGMPKPCRPRPMISGSRAVVLAASSEPPVRKTAQQIRICLGPYMSPSRPNTGVATAAVNSVAVIAHDALDGAVSNRTGSSGRIGMMSVCISDTLTPAAAIAATSIPGWCGGTSRDPAL